MAEQFASGQMPFSGIDARSQNVEIKMCAGGGHPFTIDEVTPASAAPREMEYFCFEQAQHPRASESRFLCRGLPPVISICVGSGRE